MRSLNRVVMQKESRDWINSLGPDRLDVLELRQELTRLAPFAVLLGMARRDLEHESIARQGGLDIHDVDELVPRG